MYENNNLIFSNIYNNNKLKINSHNFSKKNHKKKFNRILSAGNIRKKSTNIEIYKNYPFLPTLNNNSQISKIQKKLLNNSLPKNINFQFEKEKLYDQSMGYKKLIQRMEKEINIIKLELSSNQKILNSMNEEIEKILFENKDKLYIDILKKIPENEKGRYVMIGKMKNKINETEIDLNNQIFFNRKNKQNEKFTKSNELELEKNVLNEHKEKLLSLIENSNEIKKNQQKEFEENNQFINKIKTQEKLINSFDKNLKTLKNEEQALKNEITKYEKLVNQTNDKIKIIKIKQDSLKDLNKKLKNEKNKFNDKNKGQSLENLQKELSSTRDYYNYCKLANRKTTEMLDNMKKRYYIKKIEYDNENKNNETLSSESENDDCEKYYYINGEKNINRLQKIYIKNKKRENDLEKNLFLYQEAIQKMNTGENINLEEIKNNILKIIKESDEINDDQEINYENKKNENELYNNNSLILSIDNPYFINSEENDSISSNKFNNKQFNDFTYILFKNFQAKKINKEQGKKKIIEALINYFQSINKQENPSKEINKESFIQEKLNEKFSEIIQNLINCYYQNDIINLKVYFNIIYFEKVTNSNQKLVNTNKLNLLTDYFLSLFNNIKEYTEEEENKLKEKIKTKYFEKCNKLKEAIKEYISSKNKNNDIPKNFNKINDYISIQEIKYILDKNKEIQLKEKYTEFIIYYMKQFDDSKVSLFDLKISKLDEILKEEKKDDINNKIIISNKLKEEIIDEEFNRNINSFLEIIKKISIDENKDLRKLFEDIIIKHNNTDKEIINLESLNQLLNKRKIKLNDLQITCIKKKYCTNEEKDELEILKIENDINNYKK